MFPLWDPRPSDRTPWVSWSLILLIAVAFVTHRTRDPLLQRTLLERFAFVPSNAYKHGAELEPWARSITSVFLHAGVAHVAGNLLYLWVFGEKVEVALGHARFALLFALCATVGAIAQYLFDPASPVPIVGASAGIAGILAVFLLLFPRSGVVVWSLWRVDEIWAWVPIALWFILQFVGAVTSLRVGATGLVAHWAHLGGFAMGLLWALLYKRYNPSKRAPKSTAPEAEA